MIKRNKIPTIVGMFVLLAGIFTGVYLLSTRQAFRLGADADTAPKDVRTTNLSDTTATISWTTAKETSGYILWGSTQNSINKIAESDGNSQKFFTHSVTITGLEPNKTYFYKISSNGKTFDNNNLPWEFSTGRVLGVNSASLLVSGSVLTPSGIPASRSLVYANIAGYMMSTMTSGTGNFVFQLGLARTPDLQNYAAVNPAQTLVEISIEAGPAGVAMAQIFPQSANPLPPIILGQIYDLRSLEPSVSGQLPTVSLSLPGDEEKESKFSLPAITGTPTPTSVILESIDEGEIITTTKPSFFGRGPGGQAVTIAVQPDSISDTFNISANGTWTWSPPSDLGAGTHAVSVSWIDSTGITRIINRNFIVQAGEAPSFEATPSQTLAPTSTPAPTPTPTTSPSPTSTVSATPQSTPTASASPTIVPIPETGSLTGTILLSIMGLGVMLFSIFVWKQSESEI
jgi:hypothetical protein